MPGSGAPARLEASLHGSLAFTGKGHATDRAVILGLLGFVPETLDPDEAERRLADARKATGQIDVPGLGPLAFDPDKGVVFDYGPPLPGHANGLVLAPSMPPATCTSTETYYSIGGGFVLTEREIRTATLRGDDAKVDRPYPFATAAEMLAMGEASGLSIAAMKRANETAGGHATLDADLDRLWQVMDACIDRGLAADGTLPGGLKVRRRARAIHQALLAERGNNIAQPHTVNDWLSVYAMAVNEENAAGGQRRHRPHQRRRRRRPGGDPLLPRPLRRRDPQGRPRLPADRRRGRRHHQDQRLDLRRRGRLPGRGRLRRRHGGRRPLRRARRHATPRSRTPPRSRSSTTSA